MKIIRLGLVCAAATFAYVCTTTADGPSEPEWYVRVTDGRTGKDIAFVGMSNNGGTYKGAFKTDVTNLFYSFSVSGTRVRFHQYGANLGLDAYELRLTPTNGCFEAERVTSSNVTLTGIVPDGRTECFEVPR